MGWHSADVVRVFDNLINPPSYKRFVCVSPAEGWYFRINTKPWWKPNLPIPLERNKNCLDHDSHIELRIIEIYEIEIEEAIRVPDNMFGPISNDDVKRLLAAVDAAPTFTPEQRDEIRANLESVLSA